MAKFEARGNAIFQLPEGGKMGFIVCVCDNGDGNDQNQFDNAETIVKSLNRDEELKDLATWLLKQKSLHLNKERVALLKGIVDA